MFMKYSNRDAFGHPLKFRSASEAGLLSLPYNGENTKLLIWNEIADSAVGNEVPISISNSGVTLDADSNLEFIEGNDILNIDSADVAAVFGFLKEWTFDVWVYPTLSSTYQCILGPQGNAFDRDAMCLSVFNGSQLKNYYGGYGVPDEQIFSPPGSMSINDWYYITVEKWLDGAQWKLAFYINGVKQSVFNVADFALYTTYDFILGTQDGSRGMLGKANKYRLNNIALHRGVNFKLPTR